jgi:hypothetical protein
VAHRRRIIWFCSTENLARHPESLVRLRDAIGLTTIMPESHVCHTSGFRAAAELARRGPFEDWRDRGDLWPKAADGIYPPVSGVVGDFDDTELRRVIDAATAAGIEVWGHLGLWSYGGDVYPELALRDVDGAELDRRYQAWGIGLCPSRPEVNDWTADGLVDVCERYDLGGFCVDHARYPMAANAHALAACGCTHCIEAGRGLGFDAETLAQGVRDARSALRALTAPQVKQTLAAGAHGSDLLTALGIGAEVDEWLRMRAALLAAQMSRFRDRVRSVHSEWVFGSDVFAPTVALLGGHDYPGWEAATDFLTGGSSSGGVVGWATGGTNAAAEWAQTLLDTVPDVPEVEAVELMLRGLELHAMPGLPRTVAGLRQGPLPTAELYEREIERLVATASGTVPLYPPVSAGGNANGARRLCAAVRDAGCHGAMITLNPDDAEVLRAIREGFGPLSA